MEIFSIRNSRAERQENNTLYMEFAPANIELADKTMHGMTLPVVGTVAGTIAAYEPVAAREMFIAIDNLFPGAYALDEKYGQ